MNSEWRSLATSLPTHTHTRANTLTTNNSNKISETDIHGAISGFLLHCIMKKKAGCCDKTMNGGNCLFSKKNSSQCQMLILKWMLIIVSRRDMSHFFLYRPGGWGIHFVFYFYVYWNLALQLRAKRMQFLAELQMWLLHGQLPVSL